MTDQPITATAYIVVRGKRSQYGTPNPVTGLRSVNSVTISRITQSPPKNLGRDEVVTRVTFSVSPNLFDPVIPENVIELFDGAMSRGTIVVTAEGETT